MRNRGNRISQGATWGAGAALVAVLGLTAYAALTGSGHHDSATGPHSSSTNSPTAAPSKAPSPPQVAPTYSTPANWTEPVRWLASSGTHTAVSTGDQTDFPHTANGAIAMLVAASTTNVEGSTTMVDQQTTIYDTYLDTADQSPANLAKVQAQAAQTDTQDRSDLGLPASGPMPSGAFVRADVVGFQIIQASPDEVTAYLLTKIAQKAGETSPEKDSYVVSVLGAAWQGTDWKMGVQASNDAVSQTQGQQTPGIAAPGDAAFNTDGWTAIRQAS